MDLDEKLSKELNTIEENSKDNKKVQDAIQRIRVLLKLTTTK